MRHQLLILRPHFDRGSRGYSADREHSAVYKRRELARLQAAGYRITLAIDDDPVNVSMYRSEGVTTLYTHSGYYER